jgi:ubiquinone/menaquinone biosynthesis C-methylase UbiE
MGARQHSLDPDEARRVYDRIGRLQDSQGFYERGAVDVLVDHSDFEQAAAVLEVGFGTGELARRLLQHHLVPDARYYGIDISERMLEIASKRLRPWRERIHLALGDCTQGLASEDGSVDRVVATYVLDLLGPAHATTLLAEAHRVLAGGGLLCLASLTRGSGRARLVSGAWEGLWRIRPQLVGGCRPIELDVYVRQHDWAIRHRSVETSFSVASEVVVAERRERSAEDESA